MSKGLRILHDIICTCSFHDLRKHRQNALHDTHHSSAVYNCQRVKTTPMSTKRRMHKTNVHSHTGLVCSHESNDGRTCPMADAPWKDYTEVKARHRRHRHRRLYETATTDKAMGRKYQWHTGWGREQCGETDRVSCCRDEHALGLDGGDAQATLKCTSHHCTFKSG